MQTARRLYVYLLSGISLGALVIGVTMLLTVLFEALGLGNTGEVVFGGEDATRQQLTLASAVTAVSLPVWLIHWLVAERSVRPDRPTASIERTSDVRGLYFALAMGALLLAMATGVASMLEAIVLRMAGAETVHPQHRRKPRPGRRGRGGMGLSRAAADARLVPRADDRWRRLAPAHLPVRRHVRRPLPHAQWRHRLHRAARPPHPGRATRVHRLELWPMVGIPARERGHQRGRRRRNLARAHVVRQPTDARSRLAGRQRAPGEAAAGLLRCGPHRDRRGNHLPDRRRAWQCARRSARGARHRGDGPDGRAHRPADPERHPLWDRVVDPCALDGA